jgi:DNA (cytosine-5)-methyltransferase 1
MTPFDSLQIPESMLASADGGPPSHIGKPRFYEFFSGGGLVRLGLGAGWNCVGANDHDSKKVAAYSANFGGSGLVHGDVASLKVADIPDNLDLAWASFPCTNVSIAGSRAGLDGTASGAFWPCWSLIRQKIDRGNGPRVIALENVRGLISSGGGSDFAAVIGSLVSAGYRVGAMLVDAILFVPQSRKRVFIVAVPADTTIPADLFTTTATDPFHSPDLIRAVEALPPAIRSAWVWWHLPEPPPLQSRLSSLLEPDSAELRWHTVAETADLLSTMGPLDAERLALASASGRREIGTIYVRSRIDAGGRQRRANNRFDGFASCLVTPNGRGSSQIILIVDGPVAKTRYMSKVEGARLMGIPASYVIPGGYNAAFGIFGDGVAVPVVRHLARYLLEPLVGAATASWRPRTRSDSFAPMIGAVHTAFEPTTVSDPIKTRVGIKGQTVGTTLYLVPNESKRVRRLALELNLSLHELLLRGLDRLLAESGQRPVERYQAAPKGARGKS